MFSDSILRFIISDTRPVLTPAEFRFGTYTTSYTGSSVGYPPLLDPSIGVIHVPGSSDYQHKVYTPLAIKLSHAMHKAVPVFPKLQDCEMRTPSNATLSAMYDLSMAAFILAEFGDREHELLRIATMESFAEFERAVSALE
jgi:hypothetical protein